MKRSKLIKFIAVSVAVLLVAGIGPLSTIAAPVPYVCYNYDYRENLVYTPAPYEPDRAITTELMEYNGEPVGALKEPKDICKAPDGRVFVADTGNNRIVIFDDQITKVVGILDSFNDGQKDQKFKSPTGVCVSTINRLYVADSKSKRIVVFDENFEFIKYIDNPESEVLEEGFVFTPLKVSVDYAERVYCIANNQFEGIMVFDTDGKFTGFFGTIEVKISNWDKFWKRIASKAERSKQRLYIPTEFTGMDIDSAGFVYASNIDSDGKQGVRRLNPKGEDVIKKGENGNVGGDLRTDGVGNYAGASQFIDVVYRDNGIYSCLDRLRGRVFTYDHEGNLLYIFGGLGTQEGTFQMPAAIESLGDRIVVLDSTRNSIFIFKETEYGNLINEAVALRYDGDEKLAVDVWKRVLELDENNELANTGIGKAYLTGGDYKQAMKYLRLGMNRSYYSIAFRRYRNNILKKNIGYVLTALLVLIIGLVVFLRVKKNKGVAKRA